MSEVGNNIDQLSECKELVNNITNERTRNQYNVVCQVYIYILMKGKNENSREQRFNMWINW